MKWIHVSTICNGWAFSVKSDVFSVGVLVLEIVTGKKNRGFYNADHDLNLLGYVSVGTFHFFIW